MPAVHIQIQSVLFNNDPRDIVRALEAINRAGRVLQRERDSVIDVHYGDCSPDGPCLGEKDIKAMKALLNTGTFRYKYFNANLGSAEGHNRLADNADADFFLIQNPDVVGEPSYLLHLLKSFGDERCGMAEARQLPIEHPKEYDPVTGETSWATTACALIPAELFRKLDGFDSETFFLYCDDVDFSWRVRLSGRRVIFQPAAVVFHDKRLKEDGSWNPSSAERYYSIEASLLMAHKYSNRERVQSILSMCDHLDEGVFKAAAKKYRDLMANGRLPEKIDKNHVVAEFVGDDYAEHRFTI